VRRPAAGIHWSTLAFLVVFTVVLIGISYYVLIPGLEAVSRDGVTPQEKRSLVAWYRLLLCVLLFILFAGIVLTFRFGRFFFPRPTEPRTPTVYTDAWAESAKRMKVPPEGDEDESEERGG